MFEVIEVGAIGQMIGGHANLLSKLA
jgi:hypothetical protein